MNQIKLNGVTMTREEAEWHIKKHHVDIELSQQIIADLQAQLNAPEPVEFWEGQIVEVRDYDDAKWATRRFMRTSKIKPCFVAENDIAWSDCRPLQDPLILQFKPHTPGDPMPSSRGAQVSVMRRDGVVTSCEAWQLDWDKIPSYPHLEIIGWMPAAGWGRSE